jgi:polyphosphate kinase
VVEVPTDRLNRFVEIPRRKGKAGRVFIALDNIIRACLPQMFRGVIPIDSAAAYCFKFSRDAELELDHGIMESLIEKMESSLKQRRKADAVRFVYDAEMPQRLLDFLVSKFSLGKYDSLIPGGRYHNSKDFMAFPSVGPQVPGAEAAAGDPPAGGGGGGEHPGGDPRPGCPALLPLSLLRLRDRSAEDRGNGPAGREHQHLSLSRGRESRVVDALLNAVHNGKKVLAVVELAARFDEQANIAWAERLTDNGIEVMFGIPGLKVHSKLLLVQRREEGEDRYYTHVGTGNFNEKTARLYTDFSLLTYDQAIGREVRKCLNSCATPTVARVRAPARVAAHQPRPASRRRSIARSPMPAQGAARGHDAQVQQPG